MAGPSQAAAAAAPAAVAAAQAAHPPGMEEPVQVAPRQAKVWLLTEVLAAGQQ